MAVTGADRAGLAAAAELSPVAIPDVVPGQADSAGGSWRGRYDRLRLNTWPEGYQVTGSSCSP